MPGNTLQDSVRLALLGVAALVLYFAGRFATGVLPARWDRAMTRAWLAAMPVAILSACCVAFDRPQIALHLPIACATAALTFGLGLVLIGRPAPERHARAESWPLLLPAVTMVWLIGFVGRVTPGSLLTLVGFGLLALLGWRSHAAIEVSERTHRRSAALAVGVWISAAIAALVSAVLLAIGLPALEALRGIRSDAVATAFLLAPAIVVPVAFELMPPCRSIGWAASVSSLAKFAMICLTLVLPAVIGLAMLRPLAPREWSLESLLATAATQPTPATQPTAATTAPAPADSATMPATSRAARSTSRVAAAPAAAAAEPASVVLPAVTQRADLLILAAASLLLLPLSIGRFRPGALEAMVLIFAYVLYLTLVARLAMR